MYTARNSLIKLYKNNAFWMIPVFKFIVAVLIFNLINNLGYAKQLNNLQAVLFMAVLVTVLPVTWAYFLIISFSTLHIFYASIELSVIIGLLSLAVLFFYIRVSPQKSLLIIALLLCFYFKVPYIVPFVAGLFLDVTTIIPISIGVFIWDFIPQIKILSEISPRSDFSLLSIPDTFPVLYVEFINIILSNSSWIMSALIFSIIVIVVNIISHFSFNYSRKIALVLGAVTNLFGFFSAIVIAKLNINFIFVVVSTIVCLMLALLFDFFSVSLDYSRAERVRFQDEDNYYYVKIIPKVK